MAAAGLFALAPAAMAQGTAPSVPPPPPGPPAGTTDSMMLDRDRMFGQLRSDVARAGPTNSLRPVPVVPADLAVGAAVRDRKGVMVGTLERVADDYAVLVGADGKVAVDFTSFAKNRNGLLINLPKSKIDAMMSGPKPKN
ncbi:hypothetical protein [Sphingomonas guangdongensis]|nr:hypothetical protein [Sphingomonas guangdongensis]